MRNVQSFRVIVFIECPTASKPVNMLNDYHGWGVKFNTAVLATQSNCTSTASMCMEY